MLLRNKITLLVCDMAGTIINEQGLIYRVLADTLKDMNYSVSEADVKSWHGTGKAVIHDWWPERCWQNHPSI